MYSACCDPILIKNKNIIYAVLIIVTLKSSDYVAFFHLIYWIGPKVCLGLGQPNHITIKTESLKQHKCMLLQFQRQEFQNQCHWPKIKSSVRPLFLRGSRRKAFPSSFGCQHSLASGCTPQSLPPWSYCLHLFCVSDLPLPLMHVLAQLDNL